MIWFSLEIKLQSDIAAMAANTAWQMAEKMRTSQELQIAKNLLTAKQYDLDCAIYCIMSIVFF